MFVVLFAVQPQQRQWDRYFELAAMLRPELLKIRGFIDNERYASERTEGRLLSLSTWEDEKALIRWRTHARHHDVQRQGRFEVFEDYHLRVGEVLSDSAQDDLPQKRFDVTEVGAAPAVTVTEIPPVRELRFTPVLADTVDPELYKGITTKNKRILLLSWRSDEEANAWIERQPVGARHRHVRIIRDYGMHHRDEAPQYFTGRLATGPAVAGL
jgi:heme-degrading monooxygenase HmoA